ncbi:30S ribosomal protein S12 methylthiotransferase RimO [Olsenella sp. YH-ols2217]|uniref:Ribosomal protein uS12 methylthiotransferase RimO n=1 Tax=Kribbibacterium absianum TaxID=3044210 RepID=A0ABT6ZJA8_9ACTN|nr:MULTISPECIES: 30S ribosomal protein S12 methylthiotransferase RimO [unclassified Olsenella]MDJ1121492.1 30S ribosomal protein S12 methylthiotransferase RimO [Olsenella sp. YH-ols2216]MDJ1128982.1 30S ribosomal protein S12 methylthiotransferase RimO [Olsenella sp. YH-ols2217]
MSGAASEAPSFLIVTLGCAKNEVDSDRMRALLLEAGYREAEGVEDADVALINTCSFLASATSESIEATLELAQAVEDGVRDLPIVMCGCVPSRYGDELPGELPEVAAFVRTDEEDGIVGVVDGVLGREGGEARGASGVLRTVEGTSAYVKISDGCDRFCSFCAIPYIRGRYASRRPEEIEAEVRGLLDQGVREIVLIGQDTGIYGQDLADVPTLAALLRRLDAIAAPYGAWLRVLYLQPEGMTDELIAAFRELPSLLPYIDIPIQHCSERVLKAMNRSGDPESLKALFERLRREVPGMVLRTTAMAGFPGETVEEAAELEEFLADVGFDYVTVFAFSPEEGTRAAELPDQVPEDEKLRRTQRLVDVAESLGFAATAAHVGERVDVIVDGVDPDVEPPELIAHAWFQAPDSDGVVHIAEGEATVGERLTVDLVDSFCYELVGEPTVSPSPETEEG